MFPRQRNNCPLHLHDVHGKNIKLSKNKTVACRSKGFCDGIVFSDRPVAINEPIYVKFLKISPNWSGGLRIGFTMNDPVSLKLKLPQYACPDLTLMGGNWAKKIKEKYVKKDSILYYYVDQGGDVHYGIGSEEYGIIFGQVNTSSKLWAVLDIFGNTVEVELVGNDHLPESSKILTDFKELFLSQEECDVVIKVKGREFSAHKAVLIARSPVFKSTFRNDMKEKRSGTIDIEDCDPNSFSDFLCYIYCEDLGNLSDKNVFSLFVTADKYDVTDLKEKCIEFIEKNLSIDTFCDAITLAMQYSETELIKITTDFFAKNLKKIIVTVKWQLFAAEYPTWSNELLIKALITDENSDA